MFTSCPECARQYRIRADQLSAAGGEVRCGFCGFQFNALGRLSDVPIFNSEEPADESIALSSTDIDTDESLISEDADNLPDPHIPDDVEIDTETDIAPEFTLPSDIEHDEYDHVQETVELPEILKEKKPLQKSRLSRTFWSVGVLFLILVCIIQAGWFNRDYLLNKYPQWLPVAYRLCARFNCNVFRIRDVTDITILNRDVRNHPVYPDGLLVNATMMNQSGKIKPYPRLQLALYDRQGEIIGFREFTPYEYLDNSISVDDGMLPDLPVHLVLELENHSNEAVGFEFRFM